MEGFETEVDEDRRASHLQKGLGKSAGAWTQRAALRHRAIRLHLPEVDVVLSEGR